MEILSNSAELASTLKCVGAPKPRDNVDEFNTSLDHILEFNKLFRHDCHPPPRALTKIQMERACIDACKCLASLVNNDHFHLMFYNNFSIKSYILVSFEHLIKNQISIKHKIDTICLIDKLLDFEIKLDRIGFRHHETTKRFYFTFFSSILPGIHTCMVAKRENTGSSKPPTKAASESDEDSFVDYKLSSLKEKHRHKFESFVRVICYTLMCVPSSILIANNYLIDLLNLIYIASDVSPGLQGKLMLSIAVSLCNYDSFSSDGEKDAKRAIQTDNDEQMDVDSSGSQGTTSSNSSLTAEEMRIDLMKFELYDVCSGKAIDVMSKNIRDGACRMPIKRALEIYCDYLARRTRELGYDDDLYHAAVGDQEEGRLSPDDPDTMHLYVGSKLNHLLYQIVISIVRVLRKEFENYDNQVDIELVIYFYEIIKTNLGNLTKEDAHDLASKLMDIIVRIDEWSHRTLDGFRPDRVATLNALSFDLIIKFIHILKSNFCKQHWAIFEAPWANSIHRWNPLAFEAIKTFCDYFTSIEDFIYIRRLAKMIYTSWINEAFYLQPTATSPKAIIPKSKCLSIVKPTCSLDRFLNKEILDAVIALTTVYNSMILVNSAFLADFKSDLMPMFNIILRLFQGRTRCNASLLLFNEFYSQLFKSESNNLNDYDMWRDHIYLIMSKFALIVDQSFNFPLHLTVFNSIIQLMSALIATFGLDKLAEYRYNLEELCTFMTGHMRVENECLKEIQAALKEASS